MALLRVEEFLSLETGNCEDCKSLKSIFDSARRNLRSGTESFPAYIEQDLLLHCIEHAILHSKTEEAEKYLETFFCVTPANLQYVPRAHLSQALLCLPMKSKVTALEKALSFVSKALEIAKELPSPENEYLIHNCLVVFWQIISQFMKPGLYKHLQKWLKSMCHTAETATTNVQWKILLWPALLDCYCDSESFTEAVDVWNKIVSHVNLFPRPVIRNIMRLQYDTLFQERLTRLPKVLTDDPVLQYLKKAWAFRTAFCKCIVHKFPTLTEVQYLQTNLSMHDVENTSLALTKQCHTSSDRSKPTTPPNISEIIAEGPSIKTKSAQAMLSSSEKIEVLTEWFFTLLDFGDLTSAKQTLLFMNKVVDRSENPERDLLKLLLKYKETSMPGSEVTDRSKLLLNVAKGYRVLQKLIEYNDVKLIQAGSVCLWNMCLKCLNAQNRCQLYATFQLIDKGMKCAGSNLLSLMASISLELGCCEALRANFEAAEEYFKKAALLDETGMHAEEVAFQLQSLQLRLNPFVGPLEAEDQAIVSLQIRSKSTGIIRSHLMLAGCALSNDLFCDIVKAEQGFEVFPSKEDWISTQRAIPNRIATFYEQMDIFNTDKRYLLWVKLLFIAHEHQWYDIVCAAAKFCLASKTAANCMNGLNNGKQKKGTTDEFCLRTLALVHLNYALAQAACIKEECFLMLDIPAILVSCDPFREQECEGKWNTYCLPLSIMSSLVTAADIGTIIRDPQFVICAAAHLWNLVVPIIRQKRSIDIFNELQSVQRSLQSLGSSETDLLLLVYYTQSVVYGLASETHSESSDSMESVATNIRTERKSPPVVKVGIHGKSKPTVTSITNLAKSAHTQCEEALLTVFENPDFKKYVPWSALHSLIKTHFRVSVNKPATTEKMLSNYVKDPIEKKKMQLLSSLEANMRAARQSWVENEDLNIEEFINLNSQIDWNDNVFSSHIWALLGERAFLCRSILLLQKCYKKLLGIEEKMRLDKISGNDLDFIEVCRVTAIIGCYVAELLTIHNPTNAANCLDCVRVLLHSAKCAYLLKNDKLLMVALTRCWNSCFPLVLNKWTRVFIKPEMEECLKICWNWAQRSEKTMSGKGPVLLVADPFINLTCSFLNALIQILIDVKSYDAARYWLEKYIPLLAFGHSTPFTNFLNLVYHTVLGKCNQKRSASWYKDSVNIHTSVEWKMIANASRQVSDQTQALCNAVKMFEEEKKKKVHCKFTMPLLELSEFLLLNDCPNKVSALGLAGAALNCKALKPTPDKHDTSSVMKTVEEKLNHFCIIVHYSLCLERGTQTHKAQCVEAMSILLSVWKSLFQLNGHMKLSDYCCSHVDEWASPKLFSEVFKDVIHLRKHLRYTEETIEAIYRCLEAIGEELDWLGLTHFLLPIYAFGKFLVPLVQHDEFQLLQDVKLLDICLRLKYFTKAALLHVHIFKNFITLDQKMKFSQNIWKIEEIRQLVGTLHEKTESEGHHCMYDSFEAIASSQDYPTTQQLPTIELLPHLLTEKATYLVKMGYIGIATTFVNDALKASRVFCCQHLLPKILCAKAKIEMAYGDTALAVRSINEAQAIVENDVDCIEIMTTVINMIEKQCLPNWKEEIKAVLCKGQELFNSLIKKNPQQQARYREVLFSLEARMLELNLLDIEVESASGEEYIRALQACITTGTYYVERGSFLNGLTVLTIAMRSILEQVTAKHGLLCQTEIEEMSRIIRNAFSISDGFLKDSAFKNLIPMPTEAHLHSVETALHFKLCYAEMLLIAGQYVKDRNIYCETKSTPEAPMVVLDYINSLPPWIWKVDDSVDIMAYDECLSIAHSVLHLVPDSSLMKAKCLYVMGQCLFHIAKNVKDCVAYNAELKKRFLPIVFKPCHVTEETKSTFPSGDISTEETRRHLQLTDAPKLLHLALMGEATEYYHQAFQRSVNAYRSLACTIALSIVDACLTFDSGVAFNFLVWYQGVQVSATMKELLLREFKSCSASLLPSVICQQDYLESNGFIHSPLWTCFKSMMNSDFPITSIINASDIIVDSRKDHPHSVSCIVLLQHTCDRKILYSAVATKGAMKVVKTDGDPELINELISQMKRLSCTYLQVLKHYDPQNRLMSDLPQFETLVMQFRKITDRLERYLRPAFIQLQPLLEVGASLSTTTGGSSATHPTHPSLLLLADKHLLQLPLETLPFFWKTIMPDCIVRDFSLQLFTLRTSGCDKRVGPGGTSAGHKSPGPRLSIGAPPKQVAKPPPLNFVDLGKFVYMLEDTKYPTASDAQLEELRNILSNVPYRGTKMNLWVENPKSLYLTDWTQNEVWQNAMGWVCHASEVVGQKLIIEQVRGTSRKMDNRLCIMSLYQEQGHKSLKQGFKDSSEIALFLSLAGFSSVVINYLPQSKMMAVQSLTNLVKDISTNSKGIGVSVSALNGVGTTMPAQQEQPGTKGRRLGGRRRSSINPVGTPGFTLESSSRPGSVTNFLMTSETNILKEFTEKLAQAEAHKDALKAFREKELYIKFLNGTLVCYGVPNCSVRQAYL